MQNQRHNNKDERRFLLKNIPLILFVRFACERELETKQNCNILTPTLMAVSVLSYLFSSAAQPKAWGLSFLLSAGFLYYILSPTGLQTHWGSWGTLLLGGGFPYHTFSKLSDLQLTDFLSSPSYIIVQSPTQSLKWHVWSSSSGNNCYAVHRSLSSGASVYECTMGFLPCPIFSAKSAYAISPHNCHWNV